jgi:hypothetical protein
MAVLVTRLAWLGTALAIVLSLLTGGATAPPAALAAAVTPSTTTLGGPDLDPKPVGRTTDLVATVTTGAQGVVTFYDNDLPVATVPLAGSTAIYTVPPDASAGPHTIRAAYKGDATYDTSTSEPRVVTVGPRPVAMTMGISGPHDALGATAQQGDVLRVAVHVQDAGTTGSLAVAGFVTVSVDGGGSCSGTIAATVCYMRTIAWPLGSRSVAATYDPAGGADHAAGPTAAAIVNLVENPVEAVGLSAGEQTLLPYRDGYRDTTALRGRRDEVASVSVKVISPTGRVVRHENVALGTGPWSVTWDGRSDAGATLAAGRYTVRQTVTDAVGATKTFTSSVTLSQKRLYTHTVTLTRSYRQAAENQAAAGWVGWTFSLPRATVYQRLVFSVSGTSGVPLGRFGPHDYGACPSTASWDWASCMSPVATFPASASRKSVTGSVTANRHGTTVRMYAVGGYRTTVTDARVTVTYGILK